MKMPDGAEHGSSPINLVKVTDSSGSYYKASGVYFIMPGRWQLRTRTVSDLTQCNGLKSDAYLEEVIMEISIE